MDLNDSGSVVEAVQLEQYDRVRQILSATSVSELPSKLNEPDLFGDTPLHWAAHLRLVLFVRYLVVNGADVNAVNHAGSTPLHKAVLAGSSSIVEFLLENGAEWHSNKSGYTPLDYARVEEKLFYRLLTNGKLQGIARDTMTIPQSQVALVIGKKGSMLDDIRLKTGVHITIPRGDAPTQEIQLLARSSEHIAAAKQFILNYLSAHVAPSQVNEPRTYARFSRTINIPKKLHSRIVGKDSRTIEGIQQRTRAEIRIPPPHAQSDEIVVVGDPIEVDAAIKEIYQVSRGDRTGHQVERRVKIDKELHRRIIGKGGETIQRLRRDFNVNVIVPSSESKDTHITVKGDASDIDSAVYEILLVVQDKKKKKAEHRRGAQERTNHSDSDAQGRIYHRQDRQDRTEAPPRQAQQPKLLNLDDDKAWPTF